MSNVKFLQELQDLPLSAVLTYEEVRLLRTVELGTTSFDCVTGWTGAAAINSRSRLRRSRKYWPTSWERRASRQDGVSPDNQLHYLGLTFEGQLLMSYAKSTERPKRDALMDRCAVISPQNHWMNFGCDVIVTKSLPQKWRAIDTVGCINAIPRVQVTAGSSYLTFQCELYTKTRLPWPRKKLPWHLRRGIQNDMYELWRWTTFPCSGKKQKRKRISQKLESRSDGDTMVWCLSKIPTCINQLGIWNVRTSADEGFSSSYTCERCIQQALLSSTRQKSTVLPCDTSSIDCVSWTNVFIISFLVIPTLLLETLSKANVIEARVQKTTKTRWSWRPRKVHVHQSI